MNQQLIKSTKSNAMRN